MSEYGGAAVTVVGAPVAIAALAVAGVGLAAMRAAHVVGATLLAAPDFAENAITPLLRRLTEKLSEESAHRSTHEARLEHSPMSARFEHPTSDTVASLLSFRAASGDTAASRVLALARAFESNVGDRLIAEAAAPREVAQIRDHVERIEREIAGGRFAVVESIAEDTLSALQHVVDGATARRVRAEQVTTAGIVGIALEDQGYKVRVRTGKDEIAVVGERGGQRLAVIAGQLGRMSFDMEGFEGAACHADLQALLAGLRRRGLRLDDVNLQHHGSWTGGPLIRAAKVSGQPLEDALVNLTRQLPRVPVRRSTSLVGVDASKTMLAAPRATVGGAR